MTGTEANPQLEDGYLRVANELWEAFGRVNMTAYESRVLNAVVRFTYGYGKKGDTISISQFADYTGIDRRHVQRTLKRLVKRCILTRTGGSRGRGNISYWQLNKHYDEWDNSAQPGAISEERKAPDEATITESKGAPEGAISEEEKAPQTVVKGALDGPKRRHVRRPPKTSSKDIYPKTGGPAKAGRKNPPKVPIPEAVKVFREAAHRYPAKSWYSDVDAAVGHEPKELDLWRQVVKDWVGRGWNPTNVKGMLDRFKEAKAGLPLAARPRDSPSEPKGFAGIRAHMERRKHGTRRA